MDYQFDNASHLGGAGTNGTGAEGGQAYETDKVDVGVDDRMPPPTQVDPTPAPDITTPQTPTGPPGDVTPPGKEGTDTVIETVGTNTEETKNKNLERDIGKKKAAIGPLDNSSSDTRALAGTIKVSNPLIGRKTNADILTILDNLGQSDISPFIDNLNVLKPKDHKPAKLESVGIYKTIDLISEGPIAGLCDAHGNLIPLVDGADTLNEDGLKGIYLNDVPVKNSRGGTLNYQRILSEIKYGTLDQGLMKDNEQKALSFLRSSQTFNVALKLPGLTRPQAQTFAGDEEVTDTGGGASFTPRLYKSGPKIEIDGVLQPPLYETDIWSDEKAPKEDGTGRKSVLFQIVTVGEEANLPSIFARAPSNDLASHDMVKRMRQVFAIQPVVYHHTITNDNVTDVEINLFVDQLFLRDVNPEKAKDPLNNTAFFLIKIGYEDSDRLLGDGGDTFYTFVPISGLCTSRYERSYTFPLPVVAADRDRRISICLAHEEPFPDAVAVGAIQRQAGVATVTEIVESPLVYPHSAIMATLIDARSFGRVPKRTFDMKLLKIKIPANYDSENREYSGNWTGQWAKYKQWSNNPAWVFYDMMTSKRYGLAKYGFGDDIVDKWNLYSIGKYCDELVETGYRPANLPLHFSVHSNGAVVFINDKGSKQDGSALGEEVLRDMFPEGETVALYKLKDESGTALNRGFRRRIGQSFYDIHAEGGPTFSFNIHKIINSEYIFMLYEDLEQEYVDYNDTFDAAKQKNKITPNAWIANYLTTKSAEGVTSDVVKDYMAGYTLGSSVRTGRVVVEKDLYKPVLEPRFSTNIYLDREQDAYNCLNDLAAIFRGMVYWNNGFVFVSNDQSRDAVMVFTNSNVQSGVFTYTGSSKSTRFTSVLVRYNDAQDSYKPKVEYIEDAASIRKYGYLEKKIIALGTTSRSQAYRLGKWFLYTNQLETDLIQFKTGIEATYLRPGDVIKIQDSLKNTKRYGGRIKAIDPANYQLTLDQGVYEDVVGQKITLIVPQSSKAVTQLNAAAKEKLHKQDLTGVAQSEIDETRATQIQQFTVTAVSGSDANSGGAQNDLITVEAAEAFGEVAVGTIWSMQNTAADYKIKEVEYRILSVTEETAGEYAVTGMMYAGSKFGAIDESRDLVATQQSASMLNSQGAVEEPDWEATENSTKVIVVDNKPVGQGNKRPELDGNMELGEGGFDPADGGMITLEVNFCEQLQSMAQHQPVGATKEIFEFYITFNVDGVDLPKRTVPGGYGSGGPSTDTCQMQLEVPRGTHTVYWSLSYLQSFQFDGSPFATENTVSSDIFYALGGGE
jgi:hypothetical protein